MHYFTYIISNDIIITIKIKGDRMKRPRISAKQYFKELWLVFFTFFKIGLTSFGGGYAMLSIIEAELVEKRKWLAHDELADIFAIAESTPGPIAINTATFIGTKRLGVFGGIIATLGVVIPSFAVIAVLSIIIDLVRDNFWVDCLFKGIRIGVLVLISKAVVTFYKDMKKNVLSYILMIVGFVFVFFTDISVVYIILSTILLLSILTAFKYFYNRRFNHSVGTPEYYCEKYGRKLEKDEYVRETQVKSADLMRKTIEFEDLTKGGLDK